MHDKGWIHRDVKPENIMCNKTGEVRVIDYTLTRRPVSGFAKLLGMKVPRQGTKSYMSPEQILCESPAPTAPTFTASGSPAMNWPAAVSRSGRTPRTSC